MTDDDTNNCESTDTNTGDPCKLPGSRPDDRCHHHTEVGEQARGGQPTKLSYDRQERIAGMIEEGHSMKAAARANSITPTTLFNWMAEGEAQEEGPYADFFDRVTRARGHGERQYMEAIKEIATENDDAGMLMSMLKQRYPDTWGDVQAGEQKAGVNVFLSADDTVEVDPETLEMSDE